MPTVICAGLITLDAVYELDAYPEEGSKVRANSARLLPGGGALLAATTIARLGGIARLAGAVGDDLFGRYLRGQMMLRGIDDALVHTLWGEATAHSAIFVTADGERTIVNQRPDHLHDMKLTADVPEFDVVLADTRCRNLAKELFEVARQQGRPAVLDGEAPLPRDLLPSVSHLALSEQGLADFGGKSLSEIAAQNQCWACVTRGAAEVHIHDGSKIAPPRVTSLETLGAGDVWHGAFAFALGDGFNEPNAVKFANTSAALFVSRIGEERFPAYEEVQEKLEN
ncbi:PfkB family carbohydrate kinase [Labrenzia sp. DG1229]|uniref:PfkB family carbohydrate kinase n=1 Tax=Labrenzia sp. DG1229 TaxID=681847 RepID=UPI00068FF516|nr:PfkB family carbohydrate kinase [Labrenzia sp. DG1229]